MTEPQRRKRTAPSTRPKTSPPPAKPATRRRKPAPTTAPATTPKARRSPPKPEKQTRRIWISGATGFVGRAVVRVLRTRGDKVIAPVRDPRKASDLLDMGV